MPIVKAPWTPEEVANLTAYQTNGRMHPFTCGGAYCSRKDREDEGILIASTNGWTCPCGNYQQDWCHNWMLNKL